MKRLTLTLALCMWAGVLSAQYPEVTLRQIQEVPLDSLRRADTLQNTLPSRWTLQISPYTGDTVTVTAVCVVPARIITYTGFGFTMLLADTGANPYPWGGILVRATADTNTHILDGFLNVETGDVIRMTGVVSEFPLTSMNSLTQFAPIPGIPIGIIGTAALPVPEWKTIGDFHTGLFPGGRVQYSTGEPYEALTIRLPGATVDARVNIPRGTFSMVDESGNQISDYDVSRFFTLGHSYAGADSVWQLIYPTVGTRIDSLRGFITTASATENPRGYRVAPIWRGDVKIGVVSPSVTTHRRNPIVVGPDSAASITVRVGQQAGGFPISSVTLLYSLNNGPLIPANMTLVNPADSTWGGQVPQQTANTFVHYFIRALDTQGNAAVLASSAFGGAASDTSKGFFFYTVLDRALTIRDIQYTPYVNGRGAYTAAFASLSGVVTADTPHIGATSLTSGGTSAWYMQAGNEPWNGIWFVGLDPLLYDLRNGDSVTVGGIIDEQFDVTRVEGISSVAVHGTGLPPAPPVDLTTGRFGPTVGNGTPAAEMYEGMLVRLVDVRVSALNPVFGDDTEFEVDDGSGPIIVRRDGTHRYSNRAADTTFGKTILKLNDRVSSLTGVVFYSFNRYKICPRTDADWGTITGVEGGSPPRPEGFALLQNYPNPFNPATTITYTLPGDGHVTLTLHDVLGREVRTLLEEEQGAGTHTITLDGRGLATGLYFYRLQSGSFAAVRKMVLLK
ncbi:MAG: T9SS type A sorting domain-containing protein [Bacteroidota bacterium]